MATTFAVLHNGEKADGCGSKSLQSSLLEFQSGFAKVATVLQGRDMQ